MWHERSYLALQSCTSRVLYLSALCCHAPCCVPKTSELKQLLESRPLSVSRKKTCFECWQLDWFHDIYKSLVSLSIVFSLGLLIQVISHPLRVLRQTFRKCLNIQWTNLQYFVDKSPLVSYIKWHIIWHRPLENSKELNTFHGLFDDLFWNLRNECTAQIRVVSMNRANSFELNRLKRTLRCKGPRKVRTTREKAYSQQQRDLRGTLEGGGVKCEVVVSVRTLFIRDVQNIRGSVGCGCT